MIRQHHPIKTAVALSAIAAALLVAGCGGSSSSGKAAGVHTVRAAYVSSSGPGYQLAMKVTGSAAGHAIHVTGTGAYDQAAHAGRFTLNVSPATAGGKSLQIDAVILDGDFYLRLPASLAANIPGGKSWLKLNLSGVGKRVGIQGLSSLAGSAGDGPTQLVQVLHEASTGAVQNLGRQTIDGVSTTGVRSTIDLSKVAGTLPSSRHASTSAAIASIEKLTGLRYLPVEAWVDASHHVRRIVLTETGHVAGQPFAENVQLDFVEYGPEPVPTAPAANQVTNIISLIGAR